MVCYVVCFDYYTQRSFHHSAVIVCCVVCFNHYTQCSFCHSAVMVRYVGCLTLSYLTTVARLVANILVPCGFMFGVSN